MSDDERRVVSEALAHRLALAELDNDHDRYRQVLTEVRDNAADLIGGLVDHWLLLLIELHGRDRARELLVDNITATVEWFNTDDDGGRDATT